MITVVQKVMIMCLVQKVMIMCLVPTEVLEVNLIMTQTIRNHPVAIVNSQGQYVS